MVDLAHHRFGRLKLPAPPLAALPCARDRVPLGEVFKALDTNSDDEINYSEFLGAMM